MIDDPALTYARCLVCLVAEKSTGAMHDASAYLDELRRSAVELHLVRREIEDIFAGVPSAFSKADARVLNLEAPVGERAGLPGDKSILAFASPPAWVARLAKTSNASFVAANNHACDLGPEGLGVDARRIGRDPS